MKNKINIVWAFFCAILLALLIQVFRMYNRSKDRVADLQNQVGVLTEQMKKASVVKHISKQMEDIAYQQKSISDKRSDEAIQQSKIANEMRSRADMMRRKAEEEQLKAQKSEKDAIAAYNAAKEQRAFAEDKQRQAEYAKCVADTLSYKALARSLGSLSTTQYQIGNQELAALLAYSSWSFANRYKENVYLPAIFNALSKSSMSVYSKNDNKGAITKIAFTDSSSSFVTTTKYGELIQWDDVMGEMKPNVLLSEPKYDFRDVLIDNGSLYALSRNGALYVKSDKGVQLQQLEGTDFLRICDLGDGKLLFVSDHGLNFYNKGSLQPIKSITLTNKVSSVGKLNGKYIVFCQGGSAFKVEDIDNVRQMPLSVSSSVTAFAWSPTLNLSALGTDNGTIYLMDDKWKEIKTLTGHRSAITQVDFKDGNLMSSSYDCTVNMWNLGLQKVEPIILKTFSTWVHCFNASKKGVIWTGDESGSLSRIVISPFDMANKIKDNLKRDFTQDEWHYYVGSTIPFESYIKH